ncbi:hypothetical protein SAMN05443636_2503 [Halobaculum gomorrense]|uniref:Uncharacterized protein n=3 Tax=Halobaculum TaxID=43927 RepID=A0A1M5SSN7_9EURY|nr:hypothetical protein SAMN05443636_2503 [Halobaculum gomorrense]
MGLCSARHFAGDQSRTANQTDTATNHSRNDRRLDSDTAGPNPEQAAVNNTYVSRRGSDGVPKAMVRKKTLSPSGAKDENGEYHNVHVNLHEDELAVAGMDIGDEVFVRVRDGKIIIQKADPDEVEHDF